MSRALHSAKNVIAIWVGQVVSLLSTFIVRMVFARYLSQDYLGLETLFSNVLSMLALAELGVGSAIVFSLYKPLAEGDVGVLKSIMRLFRRAYCAIGVIIAILGCAIAPNVTMFIHNAPDIPNLELYFLFFVANSSVSYFFSYKGLLITADQKNYVVALVRYSFQVVLCICQIAVLMLTKNYVLFLSFMLVSTLGQNVTVSFIADKMYPFLKDKNIASIPKAVAGQIRRNVAGMIVHKISSVVNAPVNTILVSAILGLKTVAIYGNYLLIIDSLSKIVDRMFDAVVASVGNMSITETPERQYVVFKSAHFVNAYLYGSLTVCLLPLISMFVRMSFGDEYVFPSHIAVLFAVWFFVRGMRDAALTFISAYGLYWHTKNKAIVETVVLIFTVAILTNFFGVEGLLIANIMVQVFISLVVEAVKLFKYGLRRSVGPYFGRFIVYSLATACLAAVSSAVVPLLPFRGMIQFIIGGIVSALIGFGGFAALFGRTEEYRTVLRMVISVFGELRKRVAQ